MNNAFVRRLGLQLQRAALGGLVFALVAPACAGRSISRDEGDDGRPVPGNDDDGNPSVPGDDDDFPGRGGSTGPVPNGGAFPAGGAIASGGAFPTGGTPATGGAFPNGGAIPIGGQPSAGVGNVPSGGVSPGGAGPAGAAGAAGFNTETECRGISSNTPCVSDGLQCSNLACGLADSGRRQCVCATNWTCSTCDFTNSPFRERPPMVPPCVSGTADEVACSAPNFVCGPEANGEYCACYESPTDGLSWDCDDPPSTWSLR